MIGLALLLTLPGDVEYRTYEYSPSTFNDWYYSNNAFNSATGHRWRKERSYNGQTNANLRTKWLRPAGTTKMRRVKVKRTLKLPIGGPKIAVRQRGDDYPWTFPVGAIVEAEEYDEHNKLFAVRAFEKTDETHWDEIRDDLLFEPVGYQPVTAECSSCHSLAGKRVPEASQYNENLRGSDFIFSFQPIDIHGRIRDDLKDFAELVR